MNRTHIQNMEMTAMAIFDSMKRVYGLGERERLLLRIAVMLHDVGKYISMNFIAESSYNIIMSNEIIGLSHAERETIALIVRYNTRELPPFEEISQETGLDTSR